LQIGVRVDEPARLEAARFGTVDTIKGLAHIYAGIALDGFRTRKLQRPAQQLSLTVQPVRPQVRAIRGHTETGHEGQDRQRQQRFQQRESGSAMAWESSPGHAPNLEAIAARA